MQMGYNFTLRAMRLFRVFKPMLALDTFKGVGHVIRTIEDGFYALCTVVGLMLFLFMAFAILGMNAYAGSYRRRCVWYGFFFFFTLVTGRRRSMSLKLSDTRVYEP